MTSTLHRISIRAAQDTSIISGSDPTVWLKTDPLRLFIIQAGIIIVSTRILGWGLSKIRQPSVIAEVIGGILLGPTVFGRIPGFTDHIFPQASIPGLNLVANLGLILFLFLVGLEVDLRIIRKCVVSSMAISATGLVIPFGLGTAVSYGIYNEFIDHTKVSLGHFLLFAGVAMAITALPVLARIVLELKLIQSRVGVVVLAAGVGNDVVGWILLALTIALVNASSGLTALWVLLVAVAWCLFVFFLVRPAFVWLARRTGSFDNGPTHLMMTVTIVLVFLSAFLTDCIGIHAIFGAFIIGLMIPHEGGFAVALTEKIEDVVSVIFLPLYFALSGLSTNLGDLNTGLIWGYTIAICVIAFFSKFTGCAAAARLTGFSTRESLAIGTLMSCKGLVELIVLNIGLQAGILDQRVFSMFVVMALVSTFLTTPITLLLYPAHLRTASDDDSLFEGANSGESRLKSGEQGGAEDGEYGEKGVGREQGGKAVGQRPDSKRVLVVLDRFDHLAGLLTLVQLLRPTQLPHPPRDATNIQNGGLRRRRARQGASDQATDTKVVEVESISGYDTSADDDGILATVSRGEAESSDESSSGRHDAVPLGQDIIRQSPYHHHHHATSIDALRLVPLTERTSAVMKVAESEETLRADPLINVFKTFAHLNRLPIRSMMAVVSSDQFSATVVGRASRENANMIVVPWSMPVAQSTTMTSPAVVSGSTGYFSSLINPFDSIFGGDATTSATGSNSGSSTTPQQANFIRKVFQTSPCDVGVLVDRTMASKGALPLTSRRQHVVMGFMGGPDDRAALKLVLRMITLNEELALTVLRLKRVEPSQAGESIITSLPPTLHHAQSMSRREASGAGFSLVQDTMYPTASHGATPLEAALEDDLALQEVQQFSAAGSFSSRLSLQVVETSRPLTELIRRTDEIQPTLVVVGRSRRLPAMTHRDELRHLLARGALGHDEDDDLERSKAKRENEDKTQPAAAAAAATTEAASSSVPSAADFAAEKVLNGETCKVIGEPAMATTRLLKTRAQILVVASAMRSSSTAMVGAFPASRIISEA